MPTCVCVYNARLLVGIKSNINVFGEVAICPLIHRMFSSRCMSLDGCHRMHSAPIKHFPKILIRFLQMTIFDGNFFLSSIATQKICSFLCSSMTGRQPVIVDDDGGGDDDDDTHRWHGVCAFVFVQIHEVPRSFNSIWNIFNVQYFPRMWRCMAVSVRRTRVRVCVCVYSRFRKFSKIHSNRLFCLNIQHHHINPSKHIGDNDGIVSYQLYSSGGSAVTTAKINSRGKIYKCTISKRRRKNS